MAVLLKARTALYIVATVLSVLTFALAAGSIALTEKDIDGYLEASAELIAAGVLGSIVLPILHFVFHRRPSTSFAASVWFELLLLFSLSSLFLGGAADLASYNSALSYISRVESFYGINSTTVPVIQATEAFGFLAWIVLLALFGLVLGLGVIGQNKGENGVWTKPLGQAEGTSAAAEGGVSAATEPKVETAPAAAPASQV